MVELLGARTATGKAAWVAAAAAAAFLWIRPKQPSAGSGSGGRGKGVGLAGGEYGSGPHAPGGSADYRQVPTSDSGGR